MRTSWAGVLAVLLAAGACGGGEDQPGVDAVAVDAALAPTSIPPDLGLYENTDPETVAAFANAGSRSVLADGRLWEVRRGDRLIGTLQISTVLPEVDLTQLDKRMALVRQIIETEPVSVRIGDVEVFQATSGDRATFVWFGQGMFEVLQLRDRGVEDFEPIAAAIIEQQQTQPSWIPLPELIGTDESA